MNIWNYRRFLLYHLYPKMSPDWILDKPSALGLGPHPHLSSVYSPSFSLYPPPNTHMRRLLKHHRANLIKRDFVMCISPTAPWSEWQKCEWVEKQEEDRPRQDYKQLQRAVCVVCMQLCCPQHMCWTAKMCPCRDIDECSWWLNMDVPSREREEAVSWKGHCLCNVKRWLNQ